MSLSAQKSPRKKGKKVQRKIVDKWREKSWYTVEPPAYVTDKTLGETPADDVEKLFGRVIEMAGMGLADDIYDDRTLKLRFKIIDVQGNVCKTEFIGHKIAKERVRSQIRRGRSRIEEIQNIITKDKAKVRVYSIIITPIHCGSSQQKDIRKLIHDIIEKEGKENVFNAFVLKLVNGELQLKIREAIENIFPTLLIEVRKSKVVSLPAERAKLESLMPESEKTL